MDTIFSILLTLSLSLLSLDLITLTHFYTLNVKSTYIKNNDDVTASSKYQCSIQYTVYANVYVCIYIDVDKIEPSNIQRNRTARTIINLEQIKWATKQLATVTPKINYYSSFWYRLSLNDWHQLRILWNGNWIFFERTSWLLIRSRKTNKMKKSRKIKKIVDFPS